MATFTMRVAEVFHLPGKTVFVGDLETEAKFLGPTNCELTVGGEHRQHIRLEGESLFRPDMQAVWTREKVVLDSSVVRQGVVMLASTDDG